GDHGPRDGRGDGDPALFHVGFVFADDLVTAFFLGVLVDHGDGGAEFHLIAGQLGHVDDLGAADLVLDLGDLALDPALALLGRVILGVFGQVAVGARFGDRGDHRGALHRLELLQLAI